MKDVEVISSQTEGEWLASRPRPFTWKGVCGKGRSVYGMLMEFLGNFLLGKRQASGKFYYEI